MKRNLAALAVTLAIGFTMVDCSQRDGPDDSNPAGPSIPTSTAGAPAPATNPTPAPPAGVTLDVLQSTFDPDRCTVLTDPRYAGLTELIHKVRITNNSGGGIYSKPALFHSLKATCGATADGLSGADGLVSGDKSLDNGKAGTVTYTFPIHGDMCGDYQLDDTWRGQVNTFVIGKVISTGKDCPSCEASNFKGNVSKTGKKSFTSTPTFKGGGKVSINWGDGSAPVTGVRSGETVSHTYGDAGKTYRITFTLSNAGLECLNEESVSTDPDPTPSPTPTPSPSPTPDPCTGVGNPTFSFTKTEAATTATVTSTLTFPGGFTGSITLAPNPVSGFSGGAVTSGTGNNSLYNRPDSNQPAVTVTGSWTVRKGEQTCKSGSGSVSITPKPHVSTCADFPPPVITLTPNVTTTSTQVTVNSITANPTGGTFNPNPPQTYNRPDYGQSAQTKTFTYTLQYNPAAGLTCTANKDTSVQVPPKDPTCGQQHPPASSFQGFNDSGGNLSGTVHLENAGGWTVYMYSTSSEARCNAGQADFEKVKHPVSLACGSSTNDTVTYHWQGHPSEYWWVAWTNSGTPSAGGRTGCQRNDHN